MHERIKVAFPVQSKSGRNTENMKCKTNMMLNHKNEIINCNDKLHNRRGKLFNCMNEINIKHDYFSTFGKNERE